MDLFKKEDNVDKFWRLLCKQLDKASTTPENLKKRLYSAPFSQTAEAYFDDYEMRQLLDRYGAPFYEKISTALLQGKINRSIAQMLVRDHADIANLDERNIQDARLNRALVHFNTIYLKDLMANVEKPDFTLITRYWRLYNNALHLYKPEMKSEDAYNFLVTAVSLSEKLHRKDYKERVGYDEFSEELYKSALYSFAYIKPELKRDAAKILLIEARARRDYCVNLCDVLVKDAARYDDYKALFTFAIESQVLPRGEVSLLAELGARYFDIRSEVVTVSNRQLVADKGRDIDVLCVAFNNKAEKGRIDYYLRHRSLSLLHAGAAAYRHEETTDLHETLTKLYPNKADELYDALSKSLSRNRVIGKQII